MCQSKAQGGQRCAGHALKAVMAADKKYQDANKTLQAAKPGTAERRALHHKRYAAYFALEDALADYASTKAGEADLRAQLASVDLNRDHQGHIQLRDAIEEGALRRKRNAAVRDAAAAGKTPPPSQALSAIAKRLRAEGVEARLIDEGHPYEGLVYVYDPSGFGEHRIWPADDGVYVYETRKGIDEHHPDGREIDWARNLPGDPTTPEAAAEGLLSTFRL